MLSEPLTAQEQADLLDQLDHELGMLITTDYGWSGVSDSCPAIFSRAIVVLGVTRSGTSCLAGAMHRLGIHMCMGIQESEQCPRGSFEDEEFLSVGLFQQEHGTPLLAATGRRYAQVIRARNYQHVIWGVKEPRLMLVLEYLLPLFEDLRVVIIGRDRGAVRTSYERWEAEIGAYPLEEQYQALARCEDVLECPMYRVQYEDLVSQPDIEIRTLAAWLFDGAGIDSEERGILRAINFVDPSLRHY